MHNTPTHRAKQTLALLLATGLIFHDIAATAQSLSANDLAAFQYQSGSIGMGIEQSALDMQQPLAPIQRTEKEQRAYKKLAQKPSALEKDYAEQLAGRVENDQLPRQFGYEFLQQAFQKTPSLAQGTVQDSYTLGIGDKLVVVLRGAVSRTLNTSVNRDGTVVLPDLPPLPAAGMSLGDFKAQLETTATQSLPNTQTFVSVGQVRSIQVLVAGAVAKAGMKSLISTNTVLDALIAADGVRKEGSLRRIQRVRGNTTQIIDLYAVFLSDASQPIDLSIQDGDRLIVPPLGNTFAIAGDVQQAGIFELPASGKTLSITKALQYAGGGLRARANRYLTINLRENGKQVVSSTPKGVLYPNDILLVQRTTQQQQGGVTLAGHVQNAGQRSLTVASTLRDLLGDSKSLQPNAYLLFAALIRQQKNSTDTKIIPVNLQNILNGRENIALEDQDQLVVLSRDDVQYLWSADVQAILQGKVPPSLDIALSRAVGDAIIMQPTATQPDVLPSSQLKTTPQQKSNTPTRVLPLLPTPLALENKNSNADDIDSFAAQIAEEKKPVVQESFVARGYNNYNIVQAPMCKGLRALNAIVKAQGASRFVGAKHISESLTHPDNTDQQIESYAECPVIFDQYGDILPVLLDSVAVLTGEVNKPGIYPLTNTTTLGNLLQAAGGLSSKADKNSIRLTQLTLDPISGEENANPITVAFSDATADIAVKAGDYVDVSQRISERSIGVVELTGQFRRPGIYDVREKETLSSVIARAGGLASEAYPYGAVFTRTSIRAQEKENFERLARQLETSLLTSLDKVGTNSNPQLILDATERLIQSLKNTVPVGRMVIEADPDVLNVTPQKDILLEAGDKLFMPKRPFFVMVAGDVLSAGAKQFDPKNTAEDYIELAGGLKSSADDEQIFLVLPNGDAKPLSLSAWNYTEENIPPGSAIIIPTQPVNDSFFAAFRDASQVLGQVALTAASVAVIGRE